MSLSQISTPPSTACFADNEIRRSPSSGTVGDSGREDRSRFRFVLEREGSCSGAYPPELYRVPSSVGGAISRRRRFVSATA